MRRILVIKHGALGDMVLAFPSFAGIRAAHVNDRITLLTTAPFAPFLAASPWFDELVVDARPSFWDVAGLLRLRQQLRGFDLVYDLQTSSRSSRYFRIAGLPPWSGIAKGAAFLHDNPERDRIHTRERLVDQLSVAGLATLPVPDLSWADADVSVFALPPRFAVIVPGASAHRPEKRWPAGNFAALAASLPMPAVVVGAAQEAPLAAEIKAAAPQSIDLTGRTTLLQLAAVARRAALAVGNDTGPMHLAASFGVPSVVLFGGVSDPALTAPRYSDGGWPVILREAHLSALPVAQVLASLP